MLAKKNGQNGLEGWGWWFGEKERERDRERERDMLSKEDWIVLLWKKKWEVFILDEKVVNSILNLS